MALNASVLIGTLFPNTSACVPTVTDNAFAQGLIDAHEVGISFAPTTSLEITNGELTFGGIDSSKFTGPLNFVYDISPSSSLCSHLRMSLLARLHPPHLLATSLALTRPSPTAPPERLCSHPPPASQIRVLLCCSLPAVRNLLSPCLSVFGNANAGSTGLDALATYQQLTGAVFDNNVGLLSLTPEQFGNLESLFFKIGDVSRR